MLVVLLPLLGTALYGNWFTGNIIQDEVIRSSRNELAQHVQQIETFLDGINDDVRYLSHLNSLSAYLGVDANDSQALTFHQQMLERDLLIFASAHPYYYQVRFLDASGMEVARVDTREGHVVIIPTTQLQDKSDRYYFIEGARLESGAIYISPLDLNREHGKIEQPLHPVIRYVTPVYLDATFRGVVVVNVEANEFLKFVQTSSEGGRILAMIDQDGFYLAHPDAAKRWGGPTDLATGVSAKYDFPNISQQLLSGKTGSMITDNQVMIYTPIHYRFQHPSHYWVLLRVEPVKALLSPLFDFRLTASGILLAAIAIAFLFTVLLARSFTEPLLALERGVQKMAQADFSEQLPVQSNDEIGQLTQSFNEMARLTRGYLEQMDHLQALGMKISSHVERDEILRLVTQTISELLPVADVTIYCLAQNEGDAPPQVVQTTAASSQRTPYDLASIRKSLALTVGEMITHRTSQRMICYAPLRISTLRRAIVELVGEPGQELDTWHCKLLSSLMAQGSIALENADLYQRLALHREQLRQLVNALMTAQEEERRVVAYDIHDGLLQYLVATRLLLRNYAALLEQNPESAHELLEDGMAQLASAINEGRRIIEGMRPTLLDDLGLEAAIREMTQGLARRADWQFSLEIDIDEEKISDNVDIAAFRIVQEALTNAYKYARGQRVAVHLSIVDDILTIKIQDWGQGFALEQVDTDLGHVGLVAMQERARLVGGVCTINSQPGQGTSIFVRLPLTQKLGALIEDDDSPAHC
jgi:signal transduction histidine kinase